MSLAFDSKDKEYERFLSQLAPDQAADVTRQLTGETTPAAIQSSHPVAAMILLATRVTVDAERQRATLYTADGFGFHVAFGKRHAYCQFASVFRSPTVFCEPIPDQLVAILFALAEKVG